MMNSTLAAAVAAAFGPVSTAYAAIARTCPESDICYQLNIPDETASSGTGDVYLQLSAPTSYSWVALGQGSQMAGSNIFVMYTSADGNNVTVSPRLGTGHVQPQHDSSAQIAVLEGSGVINGVMTANVRCSNCDSWQGGSMDFSSSSSNWIHAYKSGSALNSDALDESISQHDDYAAFNWDLSQARGGSNVNPFVNADGVTTATATSGGSGTSTCVPRQSATLANPSGTGCPTAWPTARPTWASSCFASGHPAWPSRPPWADGGRGPWNDNDKRQETNYCDDNDSSGGSATFENNGLAGLSPQQESRMLLAHAVCACIAFVALFPIGGMLIRIASFTGLVWVHAAMQMLAYVIYIVAFGLGLFLAVNGGYLTEAHPIIGLVLFIMLFFQPLFGWPHHRMFKKYGHRTSWSWAHLGIGRHAIILGIVNGGLGLQLASAANSAVIAYAVIAGLVGLVYFAVVVLGEVRRSRRARNTPPTYEHSQKGSHRMQNMNGHETGRQQDGLSEYYSRASN